MRCPKCGYISFDHLATCLNCSKDFSDLESATFGTTYSVSPPSFLKISPISEQSEDDEDIQLIEDGDELDIVDPDLNILIKEEAEGIAFHPDDASWKGQAGDSGDDFALSLDEGLDSEFAAGKMEVDLSRFEDSIPEGDASRLGEEKFTIELPDELTDISDLAPPAPSQNQIPSSPEKKNIEDEMSFDMVDLDLKLDGLGLDFSLTSSDKNGGQDNIGSLSLEDIDASGSRGSNKPVSSSAPKAAPAVKPGEMDMDADLDFELDLGGLTIPKK
jgi:hypothetical protein